MLDDLGYADITPYGSLLGEDLAAGVGRRIRMRMIVGEYGSDPEKHAALYGAFLEEVES